MNATTTTIPQPAPWSAQALIPRPVERKLTGLPKHRIEPLHNAKALKAVSHAVPLPPLTDYDNPAEPYVPYVFAKPTDTTGWCALSPTVTISLGGIARTDSMRWGFIVDGRSEYVEPVAVHASDTTDWCAIPLNDWRHGCGYAIRDSAAVRFAPDGGLFTNFGVIDGDMEPSQPAPFVPNTAPLVAARERKESDLLIKVKPNMPCDGKAPLALVKDKDTYDVTVMQPYARRIDAERIVVSMQRLASVPVFQALAAYVEYVEARRAWSAVSVAPVLATKAQVLA